MRANLRFLLVTLTYTYIQTLGNVGVQISCLAFRLGNNTVYLSTQGMPQCNQFSEEDHSTHTPKEYTVQKFKKYGTLHHAQLNSPIFNTVGVPYYHG